MKTETLERRMRAAESYHGSVVPPDCYIVIRVDGKGFSKLNRSNDRLKNPFDARFNEAMVYAAGRLFNEFRPVVVQTHSDEISIVLPKGYSGYNRSPEKLASVAAGIASAAFSISYGKEASFDGRVVVIASQETVVDYFHWRANDCRRNFVSTLYRSVMMNRGMSAAAAATSAEGKGTVEKRVRLFQMGTDPNKEPAWAQSGTFLYPTTVEREGYNPIKKEVVKVKRREIVIDTQPKNLDVFIWDRLFSVGVE